MIFDFLDIDWTNPKRVSFSNGGYPSNCELVAENKRMIVVKVPGHSFWSSVAHTSYAPACYEVWIKPEGLNDTCGRLTPGIRWSVRPQPEPTHEGDRVRHDP